MKRFLQAALCTSVLVGSIVVAKADEMKVTVKKYEVGINSHLFTQASPAVSANFPFGFVGGFGSGLALKSYNAKSGEAEFYALTDRGPNGDGPTYVEGTTKTASKYFLAPSFNPAIGILKVKDGIAQINEKIALTNQDGSALTGLPIPAGTIGATLETPLSATQEKLGYDANGLDPEGIAFDARGNMWICDEYGPFIAKLDKTGKMLEKYAPGQGLPDVIKHRIANRGFEGISVSPSGKVYAIVQSVLDINGETSKGLVTRIVQFDPQTKKTKMFAYPIDTTAYGKTKDLKLGDVYAVNDEQLLIIDQGKGKDGAMRNVVNLVDLAKATDLTGKLVDGKEIEYAKEMSAIEKAGIQVAKVTPLVDLRKQGWSVEKAEGLTLLPDRKTLAIVNDNDFSLSTKTNHGAKVDDMTYNADKKEWSKDKVVTPTTVVFAANQDEAERKNHLWFVTVDGLDKLLKR